MSKPTIHLVTQRNQPCGSRRKCCERCGLAVFAIEDGDGYVDEATYFTKEEVQKQGYVRCVD